MASIRLNKLPERTPVKLTVFLPPELHGALQEYARAYEQVYGVAEAVTELVPAMLSSFLGADRQFRRNRKPRGERQ